jgi:hypothetical protein
VTVKKPVAPVPAAVVTAGLDAVAPLTVNPKVPLPPVLFLTILSWPWPVFVNEHVTVPPTPTVKFPGVPESHPEPVSTQFAGMPVSLTL